MRIPPGTNARIAAAVVIGLAGFFALAWAIRSGAERLGADRLAAHAALKLALIGISLAGAAAIGGFGALGLRRGTTPRPPLRRWYLLAAAGMGSATVVMVFSGARHPMTVGLSLPQLVLSVWLLSSVAEELFVRGLLQGWMGGRDGARLGARPVVAASAAIFAAMHVPLIWSGSGWVGGGAVVCATFLVGWAAAELRGRSGSLLHPLLVHVFGNVSGVPFGALSVLLYRLIFGHLPPGVG